MSNGDQGAQQVVQDDQKGVNERSRAALIIGAAVGLVFVILLLSAWFAKSLVGPIQTMFLVVAGILSLVGVVAPLVIVFKTLHSANLAQAGKPASCDDDVPAIRAAVVVVGAIMIVFGLLLAGAWAMKDKSNQLDDAVRLPLLVIAGLVTLIALLAVMAIAFKTVGLANQTQALGLPEGTVRAVIALSLILIFSVVTVYLFSDLSDVDSKPVPMLDSAGKPIFEPAKPLMDTVGKPILDAAGKPIIEPAKPLMVVEPDAKPVLDSVGKPVLDSAGKPVLEPPSPADTRHASKLAASQDFAKQLLIMLGTLITSITSFYFGSKTVSDTAAPPTASGPKLTGVDTKQVIATLPANVIAQGSGLQQAQTVILRSGTNGEHGTTGFSATDTTVSFTIPTGTPDDTWDVVVKTNDGAEAALPKGITIKIT
jgi:hypothetical protein